MQEKVVIICKEIVRTSQEFDNIDNLTNWIWKTLDDKCLVGLVYNFMSSISTIASQILTWAWGLRAGSAFMEMRTYWVYWSHRDVPVPCFCSVSTTRRTIVPGAPNSDFTLNWIIKGMNKIGFDKELSIAGRKSKSLPTHGGSSHGSPSLSNSSCLHDDLGLTSVQVLFWRIRQDSVHTFVSSQGPKLNGSKKESSLKPCSRSE